MYKFRLVIFTKTKTKTKMISKIVATLETRLFDLIEMMAGGSLTDQWHRQPRRTFTLIRGWEREGGREGGGAGWWWLLLSSLLFMEVAALLLPAPLLHSSGLTAWKSPGDLEIQKLRHWIYWKNLWGKRWLVLLQLLWEDFYIFTLNFGQLAGPGPGDPDLMLNVTAAPARISLNKTEAEYQFDFPLPRH